MFGSSKLSYLHKLECNTLEHFPVDGRFVSSAVHSSNDPDQAVHRSDAVDEHNPLVHPEVLEAFLLLSVADGHQPDGVDRSTTEETNKEEPVDIITKVSEVTVACIHV